MKKGSAGKWIRWIPAAAVMLLIFLHSAMPAAVSSAESGAVAGILAKLLGLDAVPPAFTTLVRKAAHFTVFLLLGLCVRPNMKKGWHAALFCLLYAGTDEIHQHFVPGRSCEMRDVGIDAAGALCGIFLWLLFRKIKQGKKNRTLNNEC
ncbi:MAG: VanZ family protein [Lachnospiraceae bacterium]|nr:VanZ family protein [Lachnospiraceae bacterium]